MGFCAPGPPLQGLLALKSRGKLFDHVGQSEESETGEGNWAQRSQASGLLGKPAWFRATSCGTMAPSLLGAKCAQVPNPRTRATPGTTTSTHLLTSTRLSHHCHPPTLRPGIRAETGGLPGLGAQQRQTQRQVQPRPAGRARADPSVPLYA